jgi:hypothetical protein
MEDIGAVVARVMKKARTAMRDRETMDAPVLADGRIDRPSEKSPVVIAKAGKPPLAVWEAVQITPCTEGDGWPRVKPAMGDRPFRLRPHTAQDAHKGEGATLPQSEWDNIDISASHERGERLTGCSMIRMGAQQTLQIGPAFSPDGDQAGAAVDRQRFGKFVAEVEQLDDRQPTAKNPQPGAKAGDEHSKPMGRISGCGITPDCRGDLRAMRALAGREVESEGVFLVGQLDRCVAVAQCLGVDIEDHGDTSATVTRSPATSHRSMIEGHTGTCAAPINLGPLMFISSDRDEINLPCASEPPVLIEGASKSAAPTMLGADPKLAPPTCAG